ncbi:UDP-N-acetyl-D-mannosamine dehydrogenase [Sphingomicrobium lutaoense]|uniref:UDP-N-acetyl-D-mannosaminuronic acid dehydrogenase n=1 Tax=Sphingomicrobium lutaoense TaxID=515949 RepID=A0A839YWU6_9SPHN|nr:UDP-N-acetyl-D-mannosamine dehydrogenase [Sphingomicrobium lutaoense]MBB3763506.1 UDP-N-acetyl-D-mannosaminuronic acid dehydrogenase [Sphingomicrobium lutaoense]
MDRAFKSVSVIGLGYIGLPTAAMFASRKIEVIGVDINPDTVATINSGGVHIVEPDLDIVVQSVVESGHLRATTVPEKADAFLIAVPTPFKDDHVPDLSFVERAAKAIAPVLKKGDLVVLESTSPVGTTDQLAQWLAAEREDLSFPQNAGEKSDIRVAHCPERVLPGKVMQELIHNDRVIGGVTPACSAAAMQLYRMFVQGECVVTNARTAEMSKLTENSFRDVNIAFANELSLICDEHDVDVWELIALANRHPRVDILQPGPGVGGHCIAVDPWFIVSQAPHSAHLIRAARMVNDSKPDWVIDKVLDTVQGLVAKGGDAKDLTIAAYGLAFKADIDDLRESPALRITRMLAAVHPGPVLAVEPHIEKLPQELSGVRLVSSAEAADADIHLVLVKHRQFTKIDLSGGTIIDVCGLYPRSACG